MITFKTVKWKNMLSTGDAWVEVSLDRSPMTLIIGENGAGKSTILDAMCFGLFGKPFRSVNKPQLMNSVNQKGLLVEIEFSTAGRNYLVRRGMKPGVFEIYEGEKLIEQVAAVKDYQEFLEKSILNLNYEAFRQIDLLGSADYVPFMRLSTQQRRDIIEELLDLKVFSNMNQVLKEKIQDNKNRVAEFKSGIEVGEEKLRAYAQMREEAERLNEERKNKLESDLRSLRSSLKELSDQESDLMERLTAVEHSIQEMDEPARTKEVVDIVKIEAKLQAKLSTVESRIEFLTHESACPTCKQEIREEFREESRAKLETQRVELAAAVEELKSKLSEAQIKVSEVSNARRGTLEPLVHEKNSIRAKISGITSSIETTESMIRDLNGEKKVVDATRTNEIESALVKIKTKLDAELQNQEVLSVAATLLKDKGIKAKVVQQYVGVINQLVNKYLASLDFFVNFELDETFNETIKSRYRDDFSYASFSEGEKMRIDLALLLTWRAIAKMKNTTSTNVLILDEVFDASLDHNGCEEFMKLLNELGKNTNVFVISHRGDVLQDKFRSVIRFSKHKNFSRMEA